MHTTIGRRSFVIGTGIVVWLVAGAIRTSVLSFAFVWASFHAKARWPVWLVAGAIIRTSDGWAVVGSGVGSAVGSSGGVDGCAAGIAHDLATVTVWRPRAQPTTCARGAQASGSRPAGVSASNATVATVGVLGSTEPPFASIATLCIRGHNATAIASIANVCILSSTPRRRFGRQVADLATSHKLLVVLLARSSLCIAAAAVLPYDRLRFAARCR